MNTHGLNNDFLYSVSKIRVLFENGSLPNCVQSEGTGFFVLKEGREYFITNRHVLDPERIALTVGKGYRIYQIYIDHRNFEGKSKQPFTEELLVSNFSYSFADNEHDDIACLFNIELDKKPRVPHVNIDYRLLATSDLFQSSFSICDLLAFIGFPSNQYDSIHNLPILRSGVISSDPRVNFPVDGTDSGNAIAYEAFSTGGASGSPVFALQKGIQLGEGLSGPDDFYRPIKLIGINAGHKNDPDLNVHSQLSYFYRSEIIIELIQKVESAL